MITRLFDPLFISYWICWIIIRFTRVYEVPIPLLNNWLTDFVFVPIVIHFSFILSNALILTKEARSYSVHGILGVCLGVSVVYELILPGLRHPTQGDLIDVVAYFMGGLFYYFVHQKLAVRGWEKVPGKILQEA